MCLRNIGKEPESFTPNFLILVLKILLHGKYRRSDVLFKQMDCICIYRLKLTTFVFL